MKILSLALVLVALPICAAPPLENVMPRKEILAVRAPARFDVVFVTTKGKFVVHSEREWSPLGVDRFYALVSCGYYDGTILYRVGPTMTYKGGRVVQWGLHNDPRVNQAWAGHPIRDEPVRHPNRRGSVVFSRDGPNTRCVELAISLTPNPQLDKVQYNGVTGFPTIAEITEGLGVAAAFNSKYGNAPIDHSDLISARGSAYLDREYPGLDRVISARVIEDKKLAR